MTHKQILNLLDEPMKYLSRSFALSMNSSVDSKEDLYNDLVVLYLKKKNGYTAKRLKNGNPTAIKNYWYSIFKNYLKDKYDRKKREQKILNKVKKITDERIQNTEYSQKDIII